MAEAVENRSPKDPSSRLEPPTLSLVLPIHDEEDVIPELHRRLQALLASLGLPSEIIFVDDGSQDRSFELLRELSAGEPRYRIVSLARNFGHPAAITAGLDYSRGEAVTVLDADLQDPPEVVPEMRAKWREGFDVVYAVRRKREGETPFKVLTARMFYRCFALLIPIDVPLDAGDFRLMSRRVVLTLNALRETHRFVRGMVAVGGLQADPCFLRPARALSGSDEVSAWPNDALCNRRHYELQHVALTIFDLPWSRHERDGLGSYALGARWKVLASSHRHGVDGDRRDDVRFCERPVSHAWDTRRVRRPYLRAGQRAAPLRRARRRQPGGRAGDSRWRAAEGIGAAPSDDGGKHWNSGGNALNFGLTSMASLIDSIVKRVERRLQDCKRALPLEELRTLAAGAKRAPVGFRKALEAKRFSLVAEIKKKSPSSGEMDPTNVAQALSVYDSKASISAISILTEEDYFGGSLDDLRRARELTSKPILRKDFIVDEYQVWEARASGADAILLMAGLHEQEPRRATRLLDLARSLGMDVLFELGMNGDSDRPIAGATICGINSRRFETTSLQVRSRLGRLIGAELSIDSDKHRVLRPLIDEGRLAVAESGIDDPSRLKALFEMKYDAALIGTAFLKKGVKVAEVVRDFDEEVGNLLATAATTSPVVAHAKIA